MARLDGWQVWAVDRRENLLEDLSALDRARAGGLSGRGLFDYYVGWLGNAAIKPHYQPPSAPDLAFVRDWGMRVAVEDLRRVVAAARRGGRRVVLGGHSLGGWIATAYATWDFGGRAGARDLAGLVLIDGASGPPAISRGSARRERAAIDQGDLFISIGGAQLPWLGAALAAVSATLALREPDAPSLIQAWPLLPATVKPRVRVSNRAQFGYSIDVDTSPAALAGGQAHLGGLERTGDPRGFRDGGYATVERAARALSGIAGVDGIAWFQPARLTLDAKAIAGGARNRAQTLLGLRSSHGDEVDLPIYAFETSYLKGQILRAARALARRSHLAKRQVTLVDRSASNAHSDPLYDSPDHNDFQKTVIPFLRRIR